MIDKPANVMMVRLNVAILFFLIMFSLIVVSYAAESPSNKTPFAFTGPKIIITEPSIFQAQLTSNTLVAAITYNLGNYWPGGDKVKEYPHIIIAIYDDGTLIWSDHHIKGGPPYHLSTVPTSSMEQFEKRFFSTDIFKKDEHVNYSELDGPTVHIYARGPDGYMEMTSSHEPNEENTRVVGTERGSRYLIEGESRGEALAKESGKYQEFRASWSRVKRNLLDLIPPNGADGITSVTIRPGLFRIRPTGDPK